MSKAQQARDENEKTVAGVAKALKGKAAGKRDEAVKAVTALVGRAEQLGVNHPSLRNIKPALASGSTEVLAFAISSELVTGAHGHIATGSNMAHLMYKVAAAENPRASRKNPLTRSDFAEVKRITGNVGDGRTQAEAIEAGYMTADGKPVMRVTDSAPVPADIQAKVDTLVTLLGISPEEANALIKAQ
jgi:hypothetical protein